MVQANFNTLVYYFQTYGIMDFLLPFLLVFTIIYAVTSKIDFLKDNKNFRTIVALVIGLLFVAPHVVGTYPLGYDPVQVLNESLPSISLIIVAAVMMLIMLGLFGAEFAEKGKFGVGIVSILFIVYIFGASLNFWSGPYGIWNWWTPQTTELMIILAVFGLIVKFITGDDGPSDATQRQAWKTAKRAEATNALKEYIKNKE